MFKKLKGWWFKRKAKYYLKHHWHLFADIFLLLVIIVLLINLLLVYSQKSNQVIDPTPVEHRPFAGATTTIEYLSLEANLEKNNISLGQSFKLNLLIKNNTDKELKNIELVPAFVNNTFRISALKVTDEKATVKNNQLILESLEAREHLELDIDLTISSRNDSWRLIDWGIQTSYSSEEELGKIYFNLPSLKINTDVKVSAAAYYNSQFGDQLGSGPIPPIVGIPTNYWVFFEASDFNNDLKNLAVSAKLAPGVTISNRKTLTAGEFGYNENQKRVTWTVKDLGADNGSYKVGFEVQFLPSENDLGKTPTLIDNISYLAVDAYTGENLSGRLNSINTNLPLDSINQGQGEVIK